MAQTEKKKKKSCQLKYMIKNCNLSNANKLRRKTFKGYFLIMNE